MNIRSLQKRIYNNKVKKGFNVKDVNLEILLIYKELAEFFEAYHRKNNKVGEELVDVMIYCLGLAEILGIDLEKEILRKVEINEEREYKKIKGVVTRTKISKKELK